VLYANPGGNQIAHMFTAVSKLAFEIRALCKNLFVRFTVFPISEPKERWPIVTVVIRRALCQIIEEGSQTVEIFCGTGSNLWSWQFAQPTVSPRNAAP